MPLSAPPPSWATIKSKPTTVAGFGITDMSAQSVASAANANNAATVSTITTAQVVNATVGAGASGVGSYASISGEYGRSEGSNYAGSSLGLGSGTWRCMNYTHSTLMALNNSYDYYRGLFTGTFLRIS